MCGRSHEWATLIRYAARREVILYLPLKITTLYKTYVSINVTEASKELRLRKRFRKLEPAVCKYINGMLCHQFYKIMCLGKPTVAILNVS